MMKTKRFFRLMAFAMMAMVSVGLASCSSDDDDVSSSELVGVWQAVHVSGWELDENGQKDYYEQDVTHGDILTFGADGTFTSVDYGETISGTWSLKGNNVTVSIQGQSFVYKITISGDTAFLEVSAADVYEKWTYKRIAAE